jgi:signal transduction histidine kinase/DNA-binding response OmpR family regulator
MSIESAIQIQPTPVSDDAAHVLVVDDNPQNQRAFEALLSELGTNVVMAASGTDALRAVLERDFALILLDVKMPRLGGLETAELIRARERSKHTPIIFVTAYEPADAEVARGYALGAVDFLFKPIVPEILKSKVSVFLDLYRKTDEIRLQAALLQEAQRREYERNLIEARRQWEEARLRKEIETERRLAETLARKAEELTQNIVEREQAEARLWRSNERLHILAQTANQLLFDRAPAERVGRIFETLAHHLDVEVWLAYLLGPDGESLQLDTHGGLSDDEIARLERFGPGPSIAGRAAAERHRILSEDLGMPQEGRQQSFGLLCCVGFPLLARDHVLGSVAFGSRERIRFEEDELSVMQVICDQVAMGLERAGLIGELERSASELRLADSHKDEFLATLAHELRSPLAPLHNALEVLNLKLGEASELGHVVSSAARQVKYISRLIEDVSDASRIALGKVELVLETIELPPLIEQAVQTMSAALEAKHHELLCKLPSDRVLVRVDPVRVAQIVGNLLSNAARYTDPGGHIELKCSVDGANLTIEVSDDGIGIEPDAAERIFEGFVQAHPGSARARGGLGLGLSLVRRLSEMHGGTVAVSSAGLGHGSRFSVRLPVVASGSGDSSRPEPRTQRSEDESKRSTAD